MNKRAYILLMLIVFGFVAKAQGPVMSQPYSVNQFLNPASVGNSDYSQRIQGNLKSQTIGGSSAYKTIIAAWDRRFDSKQEDQKNYFGAGVQIVSDQMMAGVLQTNYLSLNFAYHLYLDNTLKNEISLGLGMGYAQSVLNRSLLRFEDGYLTDGSTTYNGISNANFKANPASYSAQTGLIFTRHTEEAFMQLGATVSFIETPTLMNNALDSGSGMRSVLFLNLEHSFSEDYTYMLHAYYSNKYGFQRYVVGGAIGIPILYKYEQARRLYLGCFSRIGDAIAPTISMMMEKYTLGISYDFYSNQLSAANIKQNSFEISLSTSFGKRRNEYLRTLFQ